MDLYANNLFNTTNDATSINEIHLKAELNPDFHIDLLTIFNNINVDESLIFMQLYGSQGYPIFKIYKDLLNNENMQWISKWCKASQMEGRMDVRDDSTFDKLLVKIRLPNENGEFQNIFQNDMAYFTLEMHPVNALTYIRFYIKNDAHVTVEDFKIIMEYANNFIERCSKLNIYTIPLEYLQDGNVNTRKELITFGTNENQIDFYSAINFINISIQQYWSVLGVNIPRSLDTMNMLSKWLLDNLQINANIFNIILTSGKIIENHIPLIYRFNIDYMTKNKENIIKSVIKFLKQNKMSYSAYKNLIKQSDIINYLTKLYPDIFGIVDKTWKEHMLKTTINMNNYFNDDELAEITQKISNLFGVTINIGLNNINVLGILNVKMMYLIENSLQIIFEKFIEFYNDPNKSQANYNDNEIAFNIQNEDIDIDDIDLDDINFDNINLDNFDDIKIDFTENPQNTAEVEEEINEFAYAIDDNYFKVYEGYNQDDIDTLQEIKYSFLEFEREVMANELDAINKKGDVKKQNALTRLQKFDKLIGSNKGYASDCQSDKKPIIITNDEYKKLVDQLKSNTGKLTPYGEYIKFIVDNAEQYENPYYYYICCMIYDFHQRKIINPYCAYVKIVTKLESVYYIPFSTANDLFITEKWYPSGNNYINRYDENKIVKKGDKLFYPDPSNNDKLVEMIKIFPNISRFHCIDFNASKNYVALPYKFIPDIVKKNGLPCCFSKTQVIPNTISNYNNSLNANNEFYREYHFKSYIDYVNSVKEGKVIYDGINRITQLPPDINILFNNQSEYSSKYMKNEWCRRLVFQGYFVSLFDFLITNNNHSVINHSNNPRMPIFLRPNKQLLQILIESLTDNMYMTMRNGLIRVMFDSKEEFIRYCVDNYFELNEEIMWEWISETFDINIFIVTKVNKHIDKKETIPEYYMLEFPQGYDLNKLYRHDQSIFIYKYTNSKSEVIYDLIDKITVKERASSVNIDNFNPFIPTNYSFVQTMIQILKDTNNQIFFDPNQESYTPSAIEFAENNDLEIIGQTRTYNLEYTDNVIIKLPSGSNFIMPVYPITLLPDSIKVIKKLKYPMYTRTTIINAINIINEHSRDNKLWYYPRAVITNKSEKTEIGFIFDKNIHMYFRPIYHRNIITPDILGDPTLQLVKQYFKPNNSIIALQDKDKIDEERDKYISNKNLIKNIIFSVEYMLSTYLTTEWREQLKEYFSKNMNTDWNEIGNYLYNFVEQYINYFTTVDINRKYNINTSHINISNIISSRDENLITSFKGSPIQNCYTATDQTECNDIPICKWDNNICKVCFNTEELKNNVINYIVNELLSSFNSIRYKIMYGSSFSTEPKVIQNYHPDTQYVVNSRNATSAIDTLNNLIRGDKISSLAENMKIVYTLTHNFNTVQKQQIATLLRSLTNELKPEVLYHIDIPCLKDVYMVNMFNDSNDFWFTTMLQMAQRSGIVTIADFRKALSNILLKNKFIRVGKGNNFIYNGFMNANYYRKILNDRGKNLGTKEPYNSLFEKVIDIFRSKDYQPTYLDFEALLMAPWNDYNIAIIEPTYFSGFSKETLKLTDKSYKLYDLNSQGNLPMTFTNMICKTLPENTSEDNINNLSIYNHRKKYLVYMELHFDNGDVLYKQVVKYNPAINMQDFEFDKEDINCLKQHSQMNFDEWLLISNIPYPIWYFGGSDDNHREIRQSACNYDL